VSENRLMHRSQVCNSTALFFAAQRFVGAATILARPSTLSFRLALLAGFGDSPFFSAQRLRCASAMAFLPAALMVGEALRY
jgi:hypothetical protein